VKPLPNPHCLLSGDGGDAVTAAAQKAIADAAAADIKEAKAAKKAAFDKQVSLETKQS
jgi:hypothetical protein